jgi:hypothetical protein
VRLTAEQIERIVREIEALEHGDVTVLVRPGRDIRIVVSRSLVLESRDTNEGRLDVGKETE